MPAVHAEVVQEGDLGGRQAEALKRQLENARVRLAHADHARLDEDIEERRQDGAGHTSDLVERLVILGHLKVVGQRSNPVAQRPEPADGLQHARVRRPRGAHHAPKDFRRVNVQSGRPRYNSCNHATEV